MAGHRTEGRRPRAGSGALLLLVCGCGPSEDPAAGPGPASGGSAADAPREHVVLISLDTLRADRLGCYGYERPTSPTLDRLAAEGVRFADVSAPASKTATSHMTMFTGVHPSVHGVRNYYGRDAWAPDPELETLPELARAAGRVTIGFSGGGMMSGELGFARGFDLYDDGGGGADRVFGRARAFLEQELPAVADEGPLFLFVHTYEVHDPYTPPPDWQARFVDPAYSGAIDSTRVEYPEDAAAVWKTDPEFYAQVQERFWSGFRGGSAADLEHLSDLYDAGIAYTDHELARLLATVEATLGRERTWIVVTSDHGEEFGEHGGLSHQTVFEEILAVPLIVVPPTGRDDVPRGAVVELPVMGADLAPSLAALMGLDPPAAAQGRSWAPLLAPAFGAADPAFELWREVWAELGTPANERVALRSGPYKLQRARDGSERTLHDLWFDAAERFDRAAALPGVTERLEARALAFGAELEALGERYPRRPAELGDAALGALQALGYAARAGAAEAGATEADRPEDEDARSEGDPR